jgi:DNA-binding YbaB/EbfC family protein
MNLGDLFERMREWQESLKDMKERLSECHETVDVGGGMVVVTANCIKQIVQIKLDPEVLKDKELAEDLILSAINKVLETVDARARNELAKFTSEMLPPGLSELDPGGYRS